METAVLPKGSPLGDDVPLEMHNVPAPSPILASKGQKMGEVFVGRRMTS